MGSRSSDRSSIGFSLRRSTAMNAAAAITATAIRPSVSPLAHAPRISA